MVSKIVQEWLALDHDPKSRAEVERLVKEDPEKLEKLMSPRIAFGTAGLRAAMEPGFGRMNNVTVLQASQGLAVYVEKNVENALERGIVVGHDHRHHSREFAELIVLAFAHRGFKVIFLGQVHTPSVPFAIDLKNAACGVMVTASHNPAKDNGYKVYWSNGCQIIPPHDSGIAESILNNLTPWSWDVSSVSSILENPVSVTEEYFASFSKHVFNELPTDLKFIYTPMHGVGLPYFEAAARMLNIWNQAVVVEEQANPDPDFPTVKFPNPEEKGALDLAFEYGDKHGATIVLANDPDADRFACAVKHNGSWRQLKGDDIGTLLAEFLITNTKNVPRDKIAVLNSTVSSQVTRHLAEHHKCRYEETLTGFKWLGNKAIDLEKEGFTPVLAYEEAIGYMCGSVHDKDGVSALFTFVQLLRSLKGTALDELERISSLVGHFSQYNSYYRVADPSQTSKYFAKARGSGVPSHIGHLKVLKWRDLTEGYDSEQPDHHPVLPVSKSSEMITVELQHEKGTARFTARGSGTEPKIKVYIEARADSAQASESIAKEVWDILGREWFPDLPCA